MNVNISEYCYHIICLCNLIILWNIDVVLFFSIGTDDPVLMDYDIIIINYFVIVL